MCRLLSISYNVPDECFSCYLKSPVLTHTYVRKLVVDSQVSPEGQRTDDKEIHLCAEYTYAARITLSAHVKSMSYFLELIRAVFTHWLVRNR